ncbi:MAG: RHS repeat-associated core domain-containing protein [Ferruginibacter sp.]|nr:RHS repeat-associated core domain-containing protein [Ferruginibacter sp.]
MNPGFQSNTGDTYLIYIDTKVDTCALNGTLVALCASFHPVNNSIQSLLPDTNRCRAIETRSLFITKLLLEKRRDSLLASFDDQYLSTCLGAKFTERFFVSHVPSEYHYTLYYYNQAGNLVKTLPPAGVKPNFAGAYLDSVKQFREAGLDHSNYLNNVALASEYRYNSLNQVISQITPDAGQSHFWYDRLGRLAVSQNAKQRLLQAYSYTLYDELGRIIEVAEKEQISPLTQAISGNEVSLQAWLADGGDASQITRTAYDEAFLPLASSVNGSSGLYQKNLRNRVSYTYVKEHGDQSPEWDAASFYSYDIHGNVDTLLQDYKTGMGAIACTTEDIRGNRFKKVAYNYDLLSGKVNEVAYQPGQSDQFFHRYSYDAENRLQSVQTSKGKLYWEQDASYDYYRHGPLARTVLGNNQVQGLDFAYTIQGWLKGINSTAISTSATSFDMGSDGIAGSLIARDAFGFGLNYFRLDYHAIKAALSPFTKMPANLPAGPATATGTELFNGNISAMAVNLPLLGAPKVYGYQYDQLNRLVNMDAFTGLSNADNTFTPVRTDDYHEAISYDPNGNIRSYLRNGAADNGKPLAMDNLTYQYEKSSAGQSTSNRLRYVHERVADGNYTTDIDSHKPAGFSVADVAGDINNSQPGDNYAYDAVGNLVKDTKEGITTIEWTVYGKIKSIVKSAERIDYTYDASGNRISKSVTAGGIVHSTFYVRDATGNVLSIYTWQGSAVAATTIKPLTQTEIHMYGSGRLGIFNTELDVQNCLNPGDPITIFKRGNKFFELSNHLGNVLATISDKKIGSDGNNDGAVDFYQADVVTANDYYPFGMQMPGRKYSQPNTAYRYGFNGKENDKEIKGEGNQQDYGMRIYDLRIAKFLSVDPITAKYPELTPYQFASNSPLAMIDIDGLEGGWELSTPAANLRYKFEMQQKLPLKRTPQAATSSPTPIIHSIHSEAPPLALQQARQRAMSQGLTLTPTERRVAEQAAITKQIWNNRSAVSQSMPPGPANEFEAGAVKGVQMAAIAVAAEYCPTCFMAYGTAQVYNGVQNGDVGNMVSGGLNLFGGALSKTSGISTPYGLAKQSFNQKALDIARDVANGKSLYKVGTFGRSEAAESQFWLVEDPTIYLSDLKAFSKRYGIPEENLASGGNMFIIKGQIKQNQSFITRPAPPVGSNLGGEVEVVTNPSGVNIESFKTIKR